MGMRNQVELKNPTSAIIIREPKDISKCQKKEQGLRYKMAEKNFALDTYCSIGHPVISERGLYWGGSLV